MADEPLLDLNTLIKRSTIDLDGTRYELFSPDELSVLASHRFSVWARRIEVLNKRDDEDDAVELDALIGKAARAALVDMPDEVFDTLTGAHRAAVTDVFIGLLLRKQLAVVGATVRAAGVQPTGATSSPGSSDIMAATRDGGWLKRLRRWFGRI
ncbi:hypothetical protein [Sphingopyxis macrogoltabida]|uniref:Uncharacterized protein n=1 Tax=Sphingopyxis macrogoltabida TaxID=33050 RepID=A0AAC8Z2P6_SPHMC|nr:hypothetical protein [Sphingopyxis macrogoltabida]ALJ14269.1 hypothetical protein LH19_15470 [Sphingopyxis macrogoltabida]AMU90534.1 hypothetical protein ATM17_16040 [Sphingopyxis macrogoltabida]